MADRHEHENPYQAPGDEPEHDPPAERPSMALGTRILQVLLGAVCLMILVFFGIGEMPFSGVMLGYAAVLGGTAVGLQLRSAVARWVALALMVLLTLTTTLDVVSGDKNGKVGLLVVWPLLAWFGTLGKSARAFFGWREAH